MLQEVLDKHQVTPEMSHKDIGTHKGWERVFFFFWG